MKMQINKHRRASHVAARISLVFHHFSPGVPKKQPDRLRSAHGLAVAHLFGFYNPKQLADFLMFSSTVLYRVKGVECLSCEKDAPTVHGEQAAEQLSP